MKILQIPFLFLLFIFQSCSSNETPTSITQEDRGQILFNLDKQNAPSDVTEIVVTLSRENYSDLVQSININEVDNAQVLFDNLDAGTWEIFVEAFNSEQKLLYLGGTKANVIPGIIVPITLNLSPTTGGIVISIEWEDQKNISDYLLCHFPFEDNILDMSSSQNNNAFFNGSFTKGIINEAINLNGINEYLSIPHIEQYHSEEKTIMFWMYKSNDSIRDTPGLNDVEGLVFKSYDTGFDRDFSFGISNNKPPFDIYVVTGNGNNNKLLEARSKNKIYPNKWYHVTGMIDKESIKLFINGELVGVTPFEGKINKNDAPIIIGKASAKEFPTRYFNGKIDDFRIYNKTLSEEEYYYLYSILK